MRELGRLARNPSVSAEAQGVIPTRRCLILLPTLGRGGTERQAVLVAQALNERGLDVHLFVQAPPDSLARDGLTEGLSLELSTAVTSTFGQLARLRARIGSLAPDVVITFLRGATARFAAVRALSPTARRSAWIVAARGNLRLMHFAKNPAIFGAQLLWQRSADRIATNSAALAGNLHSMNGALADKIVVVPNIVQPRIFNDAVARARVRDLIGHERLPIVGCLGSFQDERNYDLLARALPLVLKKYPDAHVLILGRHTGPWVSDVASAFRQRVRELGVSAHVTLAGEIQNGASLLCAFDAFALTSKLEGSSNALSEALLAGVPIATVPVADAAELVQDAGVVSRGWTPAAFADALLTALDNAGALRQRAAARGRALMSERSPANVGERWAALIDDAIAEAKLRCNGGTP